MMINRQIVTFLLLLAIVLIVNTTFLSAQEKQVEALEKLTAFLNSSSELRNYSKNGYTSTFVNEFRGIPEEFQTELNSAFPELRFYIAKMKVLIDPPYSSYDLILITNSITGEVEGFIWADYWVIRPSESFGRILKGHQAKSKDDAIVKLKIFARLVSFANGGRIGEAKIRNGRVKVELIRGEGVFGILEVKINKNLKFDRLTITEPNGKKLRYFV